MHLNAAQKGASAVREETNRTGMGLSRSSLDVWGKRFSGACSYNRVTRGLVFHPLKSRELREECKWGGDGGNAASDRNTVLVLECWESPLTGSEKMRGLKAGEF